MEPVGLTVPEDVSVALNDAGVDPEVFSSVRLAIPAPLRVTATVAELLEESVAVGRKVATILCVPTLRAIFRVAVPTAYPCEPSRTT